VSTSVLEEIRCLMRLDPWSSAVEEGSSRQNLWSSTAFSPPRRGVGQVSSATNLSGPLWDHWPVLFTTVRPIFVSGKSAGAVKSQVIDGAQGIKKSK
jgi:hypothetical protein